MRRKVALLNQFYLQEKQDILSRYIRTMGTPNCPCCKERTAVMAIDILLPYFKCYNCIGFVKEVTRLNHFYLQEKRDIHIHSSFFSG